LTITGGEGESPFFETWRNHSLAGERTGANIGGEEGEEKDNRVGLQHSGEGGVLSMDEKEG